MSPIRRTSSPGATSDAPVSPTVGTCVLHLFGRLEPTFDADALVTSTSAMRESGTDVIAFAVMGHKAQVGFVLLDSNLWALRRAQAAIETAGIDLVDSFLSITEVSEYADGLPDAAKQHRLHPVLPPEGSRLIAFYPMSKRRTVSDNWYSLDFDARSQLMLDHGRHGRRHAGKVVQLVTASTGLDDWEWGVTLFAAEPAAIKDVVYELRFDEASARFAEFGPFTVGLICEVPDLERVHRVSIES